MPVWLTVLGPAMIAAMLGVSLVPGSFTIGAAVASVTAVVLTLLVWRRTRSLGWPVLVGVMTYGAVTLAFGW
jgi:branched-subunit amino acid transport protein